MGNYWDGISTYPQRGEIVTSEKFEYLIEEVHDGASVTFKAKRNDGKKIFLKQFKEPNSNHSEWEEFINFQKSVLNILLTLPPTVAEINYEFFEAGGKYLYHFQAKAFEEGMDLEKFIQNNTLNFAQKMELSKIIVGLIKFIHKKGIIHSDLKPQQIFMIKDNSVALGYRPKIIDFDHCIVPSLNLYYPAGTDLWMSPEHVRNEKIDEKSDIFTLGLIIFFILTNGGTPFNPDNYQEDILKGNFKRLNELFKNKLPEKFANTIDAMLNPDKIKRPSLDEVQDVFFNFDKLLNPTKFPKYIKLESNGKSAMILNSQIITRDFVKTIFGNHKQIYNKQFEIKKDNKGEWYVRGFDVPSEAKDKHGNVYKFYKTYYDGKNVTNKFVKLEDGKIIKVGDTEFIVRMVY